MVIEINLEWFNINVGEGWYPDPVDNLSSLLFSKYLMNSKAQKLSSVSASVEETHLPILSLLTPELSRPCPWEHPVLDRLGTHMRG